MHLGRVYAMEVILEVVVVVRRERDSVVRGWRMQGKGKERRGVGSLLYLNQPVFTGFSVPELCPTWDGNKLAYPAFAVVPEPAALTDNCTIPLPYALAQHRYSPIVT